MQDVDLGSQLYTYYVTVKLFCDSFGFFVCKLRKETVLSKMEICLREEPDGQAGDKDNPGDSTAGTGSLSFQDAPLRDRLL